MTGVCRKTESMWEEVVKKKEVLGKTPLCLFSPLSFFPLKHQGALFAAMQGGQHRQRT